MFYLVLERYLISMIHLLGIGFLPSFTHLGQYSRLCATGLMIST